MSALGGLDILVNNAGGEVSPSFFETRRGSRSGTTLQRLGALRAGRLSVPHMLERPGASIINISSVITGRSVRGHLVHHTCKGALTQLCPEHGGRPRSAYPSQRASPVPSKLPHCARTSKRKRPTCGRRSCSTRVSDAWAAPTTSRTRLCFSLLPLHRGSPESCWRSTGGASTNSFPSRRISSRDLSYSPRL